MNKDIDLLEILKDTPIGTKLWSPMFGECIFVNVNTNSVFPITVSNYKGYQINFTKEGYYFIEGVECLLFPSKENRDWSTFKASLKHKHFLPYQKVLVGLLYAEKRVWRADIYSHLRDDGNGHCTFHESMVSDDFIIPYEGNEDKLGKSVIK